MASASMPLVATYPAVLTRAPRAPRALRRSRLEWLVAGDEPGLLLIGPAGSGKTVLAAALAEMVGDRARRGWVRLAPGFSGAADLVGLAAASFGRELDTEGAGPVELASELLTLLDEDETVLVFDDYHVATGDECDPLLAEVLALMRPDSRLVVCCQTRPAGLVGRAAEGILRVVETDELAFTEAEAEALFAAAGRDVAWAATAWSAMGGWAAGIGLAVETGQGERVFAELLDRVLLNKLDPAGRALVNALAVLPYLTAPLAAQLGLGGEDDLRRLASQTMLVAEAGAYWRLHEVGRDVLCDSIAAGDAAELRARAAAALVEDDLPAAIDLFIDAGSPGAAADVLADHLSSIGIRRAVHWLYRLPPELRRRFPPVLAFGRATVDFDLALVEAQRRVDDAADDAVRREALLALGSAQAHAGSLSAAAISLDTALRGAPPALTASASTWLGIVRWWAGDLVGAVAALELSGSSVLAWWARAEVALAAPTWTPPRPMPKRA